MKEENRRDKLREEWTERLTDRLVGLTITKVAYTTDEDMDMCDWSEAGVQIFLDDGSILVIQRDDEGNGPGAIGIYHTKRKGAEYAPTI